MTAPRRARPRPTRGASLVELLAGLGLALLLAVAAVSAVGVALRHLAAFALRAETADVAALAGEAFVLDVRRAGFDPRAAGVAAVIEASVTRLGLHADLDGDGTIDPASEESTVLACDLAGGRLSRILGGQSLPLANGVVACGFTYADAAGVALAVPPGGFDAAGRARVRRVALDLRLKPPGLAVPSAAEATAALRVRP